MPCTLEDLLQKTKAKVQLAESIKAQRDQFSGKITFDYIERCLREGAISAVPSGGGEHTWMRKYTSWSFSKAVWMNWGARALAREFFMDRPSVFLES